jgi:hypothetical protein
MTLCFKIVFFLIKKIIRVELTLKYYILFIFNFLGPLASTTVDANGHFILFFLTLLASTWFGR